MAAIRLMELCVVNRSIEILFNGIFLLDIEDWNVR